MNIYIILATNIQDTEISELVGFFLTKSWNLKTTQKIIRTLKAN